jgi:replication factor C subunit 2/4
MEIAGAIPDAVVSSLLQATQRSIGILAIDTAVRDVIASGYPAGKVLEQFQVFYMHIASNNHSMFSVQSAIENDADLTDASKSQICLKIGDMDQALAEGADEYLQLLSLLSYTSKIRMNQGMSRGLL